MKFVQTKFKRGIVPIILLILIPFLVTGVAYLIIGLKHPESYAFGAPNIDITAEAVQKVHQIAVPHTDAAGNFKNTYDASSFLPLGIYNPTLCQVTKTLAWTPQGGYSGDYRIKVNYGSSRAAGTYLIADINVGNVTSGEVGNLPPSSSLYYSIWLNGTSTVIAENPFTSDVCANVVEDQNLQKLAIAGFNLAILEKNVYPDSNVLARAQSSGVKLILDMRDRPNEIFASLKDNTNVFGFYVGDDDLARAKALNTDSDPNNNVDVNAIYNNLKTYSDSLESQTQKVVLEAEPNISTSDAQWVPWYSLFDNTGNVSFHYQYPKSSSPIFPWTSLVEVADTVSHQVQLNGDTRPSWFIEQAINLKWVIPLEFPTPPESRAMAYTAIIHGATGLFQFSHDGWLRRQPKGSPAPANQNDINWWDRHAGIKGNTPVSYPGGDKWAYSASSAEQAESMALWNGQDASQNGLNKELADLKQVILSPTATDDYQVFVDQRPSVIINIYQGPISPAPIRTMLKKVGDYWYLFAVNIDNQPINAKFVISSNIFTNAQVLYENRNATLIHNNEISELFNPFDVNIYKLTVDPATSACTFTNSAGLVQKYGDVNNNGVVNAADATLVLRSYFGIDPPLTGDAFKAGDVNGNFILNASDATLIRRVVFGIDTKFPVCP
ncbi:MAG: dockerin type I repeat-containing protein [Patescibacteria group bacterium]